MVKLDFFYTRSSRITTVETDHLCRYMPQSQAAVTRIHIYGSIRQPILTLRRKFKKKQILKNTRHTKNIDKL